MPVQRLTRVAAIALVGLASALTIRNVWQVRRLPIRAAVAPLIIPEWRSIAAAGEKLGASQPSVVVTVFSDYECPGCRSLHHYLAKIRPTHQNQLEVVWRHYPLRAHPVALPAARSAVCAAKLGSFDRYNDMLFENPAALIRQEWVSLAVRAGIRDTMRFSSCIGDSAVMRVVERDIAAGRSLGIFVTPTVLVDSALFAGLTPELRRSVEVALRGTKQRRNQVESLPAGGNSSPGTVARSAARPFRAFLAGSLVLTRQADSRLKRGFHGAPAMRWYSKFSSITGESSPCSSSLTSLLVICALLHAATASCALAQTHWSVDSVPSVDIHGLSPTGAALLELPVAGVRQQDGTIVIADGRGDRISFFDARGHLLRTVGRSGDGPGEFRLISWLGQCAADSLFVWDFFHQRLTALDKSGRMGRQLHHPVGRKARSRALSDPLQSQRPIRAARSTELFSTSETRRCVGA